nr:putative replication associated protein [Crucivirus sp.]
MTEEIKTVSLEYVDVKYDEVGRVIYTGDFLKQRSRNWLFTWNNYTEADIGTVKTAWPASGNFRGLMFELEVAPTTGTAHLQGFICFDSMKSGKQIKELSPKVNFRVMLGSIEQNKTYCSKDASGVVVLGTFPMSQKDKGVRGIAGAKAPNTWGALVEDMKAGKTRRELYELYPKLAGTSPSGFEKLYQEFCPVGTYSILEHFGAFLPWQKELADLVQAGPDERSVIWIYSSAGGVGKSAMYKHLVYNAGIQPMKNATTRDLACAWKCGSVTFDFARDMGDEKINYSFIENVKDGICFSSKYESASKLADPNVHRFVICFANEPPRVEALTLSRWMIYDIVNSKLVSMPASLYVKNMNTDNR